MFLIKVKYVVKFSVRVGKYCRVWIEGMNECSC